jgi:hypothetical protein
MRKDYYNPMRNLAAVLSFISPLLFLAGLAFGHQSTGVKTSSLESHEGMTVSARPWTDAVKYKENFPKKSPYSAGIVAIQVSFRNDSDESVRIDLDNIRLMLFLGEDNRQELRPLTPEEVADLTLFKPNGKDPTIYRPKIPLPTGKPKAGRGKDWDEMEAAAQNAAVPSSVVAARSTVQGLLYFDLRRQWDLLNSAHLYLPNLVTMEKHHSLLYFEIDLSRPSNN